MKPFRYLVVLALLVATASPGSARAEDDASIEPWHNAFAQARYEIGRNRMDDAREILEEIVDTYEDGGIMDRASSLYTETYLRERRYEEAIDFMDEALGARGENSFETTRRLYTATERRIRRARNRAREAVDALEERYEDISWWNVFKIFDKLGRRKDLKEAEKDLEELEDLHHRFDPRHLFPVPALTVDPDEDGISDDEADESTEGSDGDETADTGDATTTDDEQEDDESESESEKAEVAEAVEETESEEAVTEEASEEATEEAETEAVAASTDAEASESEAAPGEAASEDTAAAAPTDSPEAMNRDTAKEVLAEEIAALVALIPEDKLDQADAILGTEAASEDAEPSEEIEGDSAEGEAAVAETGDEESEVAEETAESEPGDEAAASPTEGTLELMPSSPDTSSTSATAEVAATDEVEETTAADVASLGNLREQYYAAYQRLQQALVAGDQDAIKTARQAYLGAVQAMQSGQAHGANGTTAPDATEEATGPAAPSDSTSGPADVTDSAASVDGAGPAAPAATPAPAGTGVNPTAGFIRRDRAGIQRGVSDGGIRTSRGSLRR